MTGFTGEKGVLKIASDGTTPPWEYTYNGKLTGYEIELVCMFCRENGYTPSFDTMTFAAVIPAISSEKYDMAAANISVTKERAESVYFSDKESGSKVVFVTADISAQTGSDENNTDFLESIAESFEKNFIREDRWKMILDGIGTTCLITVMSTLFGTILAFLICMFRRTGSRLANAISNIYVKLLQGTPMVVLLMILYYVIFGKSGLDAVWVAVIGFSLNVGAYVSEIMRSGIESIDGGQREAALALGYSETQAFFRFIFPQAAVRFLPVYKQEIVSLLKSTSIVGYIAIQDLTKMSDIIRSRTYEAFFPLIATAIIYFILAWIISIILKYVLKAVSPKRKRGATK
jgi:amine acid ABC transporter, permease protein, 3-TM region, His/Glu/Gln/Arg/opine family